jgi:hypothetical protein
LGWRRQATRRATVGGQLGTSLFDSSNEQSIQVSPQTYLGYRLEDRIDLSLSIGPSWIRTDQTGAAQESRRAGTSDALGFAAEGRMELALTRDTEASVGLARGLDQSGEDGSAVERTRVDAAVSHQLTGRLRLQLEGLAQRRSGLGDNSGDDTVDVEIGPLLRHKVTERIELGLGYRWRHTARDDGGNASSSAVFLRLTYVLPTARLSR